MFKRVLLLVACAGLILMISGCATSPERAGYVIDSEYVGKVNRAASRPGVQVIWINPPRVKEQREAGSAES